MCVCVCVFVCNYYTYIFFKRKIKHQLYKKI